MEFVNFFIETSLVPKTKFHYEDLKLIIYPSKWKSENSNYPDTKTKTGLIFYDYNGNLTHEKIKSRLTNFYIFFQFLHHSPNLFTWFIDQNILNLDQGIKDYSTLDDFLKYNYEQNYDNIEAFYKNKNVYDDFTFWAHLNSFKISFPTESMYKKFLSLSIADKLYEQINLFSVIEVFQFPINRIYDNTNTKVSLMFTIINSMFDDFELDRRATKTCENCGFEKHGHKSMKNLLREFSKQLGLNTESEQLFNKILWKHYRTRNDFFHEAKSLDSREETRRLVELIGSNTFSLQDELDHSSASHSGYMIIKEIAQWLLIEKLNAVSDNK